MHTSKYIKIKKENDKFRDIVFRDNKACDFIMQRHPLEINYGNSPPKYVKKNKVHIFSSNYALYGDLSRRVMKTLKSFSDKIEIYSIDEAFVDLSHIKEEEVENYGKK